MQTPADPPRLIVFLSGGGRTFVNLQDAILAGRLRAQIALVVASRPCPGVERARERHIPVTVRRGVIPAPELAALFLTERARLGVLAGYLVRIDLPPTPDFARRIVNIHPALLPEFGGQGMYGLRVHEAVLKSGARESGCTVHFVDPDYDTGPIILQARCPVQTDDSPESLAARVFALETEIFPRAIAGVLGAQPGTPGTPGTPASPAIDQTTP